MRPTVVVNKNRSDYDVYIGRGRGSPWGNPFRIGRDGNRAQVIAKYREYILDRADLMKRLPELKGKRLGCFCAPQQCHGDVLAELVNALPPDNFDNNIKTDEDVN